MHVQEHQAQSHVQMSMPSVVHKSAHVKQDSTIVMAVLLVDSVFQVGDDHECGSVPHRVSLA